MLSPVLCLAFIATQTAAVPSPAAQTPTLPSAPLKVLVLDLRADTVSTDTTRLVRDEIAVDMGRDTRLDVLSSEDLRNVVSIDAQKQAMGCDESSCLAEVGAALGARYIVHGSVGQLGKTTIVHLNLFDTQTSRSVARETAEATTPETLLPAVRAALLRLRTTMLGSADVSDVAATGPGLSGLVIAGGAVAVAGVVGLVVGAVLIGIALPTFSDTTPPDQGGPSVADRLDAQARGRVGTVLVAVGAIVVVAGAALGVVGALE